MKKDKDQEAAQKLVDEFEKKYGTITGCSDLVVRITALLKRKNLDHMDDLIQIRSQISLRIDQKLDEI